jgi:flagellar motor switch protein FliN/FliY
MSETNEAKGDQVSDDDWASALDEQAEASSESGGGETDAAWAEAMAEQARAENSEPATANTARATASHDDPIFKPLAAEAANTAARGLDTIMEIPVTLAVELGTTRLTIRELLNLDKGSIVELDGLAGEPMDILINGYLIAQGEVVGVDDKYGIRITEIITPAERIHRLNR